MIGSSRKVICFLLTCTLLAGTGCSGYKELVVGDVKAVRFSTFEKGKLGLEVDIPVENPSKMNFKISDVDILILLNEMPIGNITNIQKVLIEKKSDRVYTFPLDVNISGLSGGSKILLSIVGKGSADIEAKGYLKVRSFVVGTKIPIQSKENLNLY